MSARQKILAALLSVPLLLGVIVYGIFELADALDNRSLASAPIVGGLFFASMILQPIAMFISFGWVIASWANQGRVAPWLLWIAAGNGAVYYLLYKYTHF